jgi:hypothetical protein
VTDPSLTRPELRSLNDIEESLPNPDNPTALIQAVYRFRAMPISEIGAAGFRMLLAQRVSVALIIGPALDLLRQQPLVKASFYPGDLLKTVLMLHAESEVVAEIPRLLEISEIAEKRLNEIKDKTASSHDHVWIDDNPNEPATTDILHLIASIKSHYAKGTPT